MVGHGTRVERVRGPLHRLVRPIAARDEVRAISAMSNPDEKASSPGAAQDEAAHAVAVARANACSSSSSAWKSSAFRFEGFSRTSTRDEAAVLGADAGGRGHARDVSSVPRFGRQPAPRGHRSPWLPGWATAAGLARSGARPTFQACGSSRSSSPPPASGAAWAKLAAWRAGERTPRSCSTPCSVGPPRSGSRSSLRGCRRSRGWTSCWDRIARGDAAAFAFAAAVGLVEEGAKLTGLLLVLERGRPDARGARRRGGVAAGFSALEALVVLGGDRERPRLHARRAGADRARAPHGALRALDLPGAARPAPARSCSPRRSSPPRPSTARAISASPCRAWVTSATRLALAAPALMLFARARARRRRAAVATIPTWSERRRVRLRLADPRTHRGTTTPRFTGGRPVLRLRHDMSTAARRPSTPRRPLPTRDRGAGRGARDRCARREARSVRIAPAMSW